MRKFFGIIFGTIAFVMVFVPAQIDAQEKDIVENSAVISVFVRDDCAHCVVEKEFLADFVEREDRHVIVKYHDLSAPEEYERFKAITQKFNLVQGTPITLVGTTLFQGFDTAETTGKLITKIALQGERYMTFADALIGDDESRVRVASSLSSSVCADDPSIGCDTSALASVRVPLIGTEINLSTLSLVSVSLILGFVDGFNPCALWVLIVFVTLLLRVGSRRRMIQYAGLFIIAEAAMYWMILMVWLSAWNFIGLSRIVTPLVGMLALGSGLYFLYKFATWKSTCTITSAAHKKKTSDKIEKIVRQPLTIVTGLGIIGLAFSVNIFEFACSVGIPQAFTKILELNALSFWETQWHVFLYILMYMVDDVIVFALALWGADRMGDIMKYSKWTTLVGGVLMAVLGIIMLLAPDLLVF